MANPNVILQWNCNGLKGNRLELEVLIAEYSPAVICLQETRLNTEVEKAQKDVNSLPSFVKFRGYTSYFKCIPSGHNGLAIYVKNGIIHSPVPLKTRLQALAVRITFQGKEFIVSNHYTSSHNDGVPSSHQFDYIVRQFDKPYVPYLAAHWKALAWKRFQKLILFLSSFFYIAPVN